MSFSARLLLVALVATSLGCPTSPDDATDGDGDAYYGPSAVGGWECEEPEGQGSDVLDITAFKAERDGDGVVVTIAFAGDIEAYDAATDEKLPISVQFWLADEYVEALFSDKTSMKVVDDKAGVSYELDGNKIRIRLTGLAFDLITTIIANAIVSGFPDWDGLCTDSVEIDATDPAAQTPIDLPGIIMNNDNNDPPPNIETPAGPTFIMLTDLSAATSGDFPGSDIDRVEVCKSVNSDCTMADVVAAEAAGVVNSGGLTQMGGSDACMNGTFTSLAGGYVIATFSNASVEIVEGDNIRVFGLPELLCAEAGPDAEQTFEVSVGYSNVVDQFDLVGECDTSIPCRLPVPAL